ncbi:MAG: STAS domain-containing protein [Pseudomonadota bacterium]
MEPDGPLVIDVRKPGWASNASALVAGLAASPPSSIQLMVEDAEQPGGEEAQILLFLARHAEAADIPLTLDGAPDALNAGLLKIGLDPVFPAEGDATP